MAVHVTGRYHPYVSSIVSDVDYQASNQALSCEYGSANDPESGIVSTRVCWTSSTVSPPDCDVVPWRTGAIVTARPLNGTNDTTADPDNFFTAVLSVPPPGDVKLFCVVEHTNGAGVAQYAWSDGVIVTETVPVVLQVSDGFVDGLDVDVQTFDFLLSGSWSFDATVPVYRSDSRAIDTAGRVIAGPVAFFHDASQRFHGNGTLDNLALPHGVVFRYCVRGYNAAGIVSREVCSNGVSVGQAQAAVMGASAEPTTVMVTANMKRDAFVAQDDNATSNATDGGSTDALSSTETYVIASIPPAAVPANASEQLMGGSFEVAPSGTSTAVNASTVPTQPPTVQENFQFGGT